jgi:hypothetical protein
MREEQRSLILERIGYLIFPGGMIVLPVLVGAWFISVGFSSYRAAADFGNKAISTTGVVTETTTVTSSGGGSLFSATPPQTYDVYTVQFQTKDICPIRQPSLCNSRKVQVLYAFDNPQLSMIKGGDSPLDRARSKIGWGIFMLLSGIFTFIIAPSEYGGRFGPTRRRG